MAIFAMLPGFALPFVLTAVLGKDVSDPFFLATSVALVLTNILGNTIEVNSVVQFGRVRAQSGTVSKGELRRYRRVIRKFTLLSTLLGGSALIGAYYLAILPEQRSDFLVVAVLTLMLPLIGGEASSRSGQLISCGKQEIPILLQALKAALPLLLVLVWPGAPLITIALSIVVGEAIRLTALLPLASRLDSLGTQTDLRLETGGLITQSLSTATVQLAPVTDRMFLSAAPTGSLSAYELADKIFFAGVQFFNLSYIVRRVGRWSELRSTPMDEGFRLLRRDLFVLLVLSSSASVIAIGVLQMAPALFPIPEAWQQGLAWSQLLLISLPVTVISMACSRLLVVADRQSILLWFAATITLLTVLLDGVLFAAMGPIGIPIASVSIRTLTAITYVIVTWRCLVPVIGADLGQFGEAETSSPDAQGLAMPFDMGSVPKSDAPAIRSHIHD
ncbi:hypothetical protein ACX80V_08475 [Arthrobacter sp. MDT3-24]